MNIRELSNTVDIRSDDIIRILHLYGFSLPLLEDEEVCLGHIDSLKSYVEGQRYSESIDLVHSICLLDRLDLSQIPQKISKPSRVFRLLRIRLMVAGIHEQHLDLESSFAECKDLSRDQFSLLIGVNGVGKSTILRRIVDFFIDLEEYIQTKQFRSLRKQYIQITGVSYIANGEIYHIDKRTEEQGYDLNGAPVNVLNFPLPNIVASCFGIADKFPIKRTFSSSAKFNRYNTSLYSYVGSKATSNIFSTSTTLFQLLENVLHLKSAATISKVGKILNFIGYAGKLTLECRVSNSIKLIGDFEEFCSYLHAELNKKTLNSFLNRFLVFTTQQKHSLYETYCHLVNNCKEGKDAYLFNIPFNVVSVLGYRDEARNLYFLRQINLIRSVDCYLYNQYGRIRSSEISSGEFNLLCTMVGALSASEYGNVLLLLDEPEISQHPNWQMQVIDLLNEGLQDCACHFLIATHSHFLVSDLPLHKSSVTYLYKNSDVMSSQKIEEETFGWSAEEVLLKVFKVPTARNVYLAKIVGGLLDNIANNTINKEKVVEQISFLKEVVSNMNDVDPMKKIILTIIDIFNNDGART